MNVSVIIPVFNVAPYIEDCLRSVMCQTYKGCMECLIVDDCGTDDSIAIVERMISEYDGSVIFQIVRHDYNRGLSAARNTGTLQAKGEYIYYLDGDDVITDDCIEKLMDTAAQDASVEMVQGNAKTYNKTLFDNRTRHYSQRHLESNEDIRKGFYNNHEMPVSAWNKLIKRSFLIQNQLLFKEGLLWEDSYWLFFVLKYLKKMCFVTDVTYLYRVRPASIMTGIEQKTKAEHRAVFYQDVLTHLTPCDERFEIRYIMTEFLKFYTRFAGELPMYRNLFSLFWEKARELGAYKYNVALACCYVLGKIKYGWVLLPMARRLKHPDFFPYDIQRFYLSKVNK